MSTKESTIQHNILKYLNNLDECKAVKYQGGYYSKNGTPDILCCFKGYFVAFEVKGEKGVLTKLQQKELEAWGRVGAESCVVRSIEDVKNVIEGISLSLGRR